MHEVAYLPFAKPASLTGSTGAVPRRTAAFELVRRSTRRLRLGLGLFTQTQMLGIQRLVRRACELLARERFDFMISTSGPEVSTFVAHAVTRRTGLPWIADYRDLWFEEFALQRFAFTTWATGTLNLRMLRKARAVSTISDGLAGYLKPLVRCPVWVSYNGFLEEAYAGIAPKHWNDGRIHLVHTGSFYPGKRDPDVLFRELAAMPELRGRLHVDLYGPDDDWVRERIVAHGVQDLVRVHGPVSYQESLSAQLGADCLLFIDWMDDRAEGVLSGKLFEYLASGRPTLVIGSRPNTEAAGIFRDCGAGEVCVGEAAIRAALRRVSQGSLAARPDPQRIAPFSRAEQARALLARIEALLREG